MLPPDIAQSPTNNFQRLVRFLAKDGRTYYGDAILPSGVTDIGKATSAKIIQGPIFGQHKVTDQVVDIKQLLTPLAREGKVNQTCPSEPILIQQQMLRPSAA